MGRRLIQGLDKSGYSVIAGILASLIGSYLLVRHPTAAEGLIGLAVLLAAIALSGYRPAVVLLLAWVALALIPFDGAPHKGVLPFYPGLVLWIAIALALLLRRIPAGAPRSFNLVDAGAAIFFLSLLPSVFSGVSSFRAWETAVIIWGGPYLAGRIIASRIRLRTILSAIVTSCAVLVPFAAAEWISHTNLFDRVFSYSVDAASGLGVTFVRFGVERVQTSFEQPILFALFVAGCAILALALAADSGTTPGQRCLLLALAIGFAVVQSAALARLGYVLLGTGAALFILVRLPSFSPSVRVLIVTLIFAFALAAGSVNTVHNLLTSSGDTGLSSSSEYRTLLLAYARRPGVLRAFGTTMPFVGPGGDTSVDNEYLGIALRWGLVGAAGFLVLPCLLAADAWRRRRFLLMSGVYAVVLANFVALFGVAFISQQQLVIWFLVGVCAGCGTSEGSSTPAAGAHLDSATNSHVAQSPAPPGTVSV